MKCTQEELFDRTPHGQCPILSLLLLYQLLFIEGTSSKDAFLYDRIRKCERKNNKKIT